MRRPAYKAALRKIERAIAHAQISGDLADAEALAQEANRIADETEGRTHKRALELADWAQRVAREIRERRNLPLTDEGVATKDISPVSIALVLIGGLVMLIAVFLPRVESSTFARVEQNTLIQSGDGWWFVGIAIGLAGMAWVAYQKRNPGVGSLVPGVAAIALAFHEGTNKGSLRLCPVGQGASALGLTCSQASPGIGIYAAGVGGLLAAIGGWQMWRAPHATDAVFVGESAKEPSGDDVEARLARLEALHERGLITDAEYTERRGKLIDQL
jgi:Short C-terminal domain